MRERDPAMSPLEDEGGVAGREALIPRAGLWQDAARQLRRTPRFWVAAGFIVLFLAMAAFPSLFTSADPNDCNLSESLRRPGLGHWFGNDLQGCDYWTQGVYGARASMSVGLAATSAAALIAVAGGLAAGYFTGLVDNLIARATDAWFTIPMVLGGAVVFAVLEKRGILQVSVVLALLSWPPMLRMMRSATLVTRETDYVKAARALGAGSLRILRRHILPNSLTPLIAYVPIAIGIVMSAEAALSYLGVGLQLPTVSWGLMLAGPGDRVFTTPHLLVLPSLFLVLTIGSLMVIGDSLREALHVQQR